MSKVIELDPTKRFSKEALDVIQREINSFKVEDLQSATVIYKRKNEPPAVWAYGLDFESLGLFQAFINQMGQELLEEDFNNEDQ